VSNSLLTPTIIAKEGLMQLRNNLVMGGLVHREYREEFRKVGDTIQIRRPVKFTAQDGATRIHQDVTEGYISMVVNKRKHVSWGFTTQDLTLTVEQYSERYITPAAIELANVVDTDLLGLYDDVANSVGTPGSTPNTFMALGDIGIKMDDNAVPDDGRRYVVLNPKSKWYMADALKGSFDKDLAKNTVRRGMLGRIANLMTYGDQNVARHTTGSRVADSITLTGNIDDSYSTSLNYSEIGMENFDSATGTIKAGDVFTIADVYAINPRNRNTLGELQQFVVLEDGTVSGSAVSNLKVFPRIIDSGAYQTVSASAVAGAAITFLGSASTAYPQNIGFHRNAFGLVFMPLELPRSATFKARSTHEGTSIRIIEDFDIDNDEEIIRMDILYAVKTLYGELGVRLWS